MDYQEELKKKKDKDFKDYVVKILDHHGFRFRDRWYEREDYKAYGLRSGDFIITKDGQTIFHGQCLDGMEVVNLLKMLGIIER